MSGIRAFRGGAVIASGAAAALLFTGCASAPAEVAAEVAAGGESSSFKACAVSGSGGWLDKSFNEQVYNGLHSAGEELGIEVRSLESQTFDDFAPGLESLAQEGCQLIFSVGFEANDAVNAAASNNPGVNYVTVDGYSMDESAGNLKAVTYLMDQSSYLSGYAAAAHSTSHVIGTFGAIQNSAITDFMDGYYHGAQQWAEDNATPTTVVGWDPTSKTGTFVGNFDDQIMAKSIASGQLDQGADVLFPVAGPLFTGASAAIKDYGSTAVFIGVDSDVVLTSPQYADIALTSVEKRTQKAVEEIIALAAEGTFDSEPYVGTLENDGTGLASFRGFESSLPVGLPARLGELSADIISGAISSRG